MRPRARMADRHVREMSIDELRGRVEEAEKLLRVARQLAQDELCDPEHSEHAKNRIASLCSEVSELFPGMGQLGAQVASEDAPAPEGTPADETADETAGADDDASD